MSQKSGTKPLSKTPNNLIKEAADNVASDLVGKLIRSKNDPLTTIVKGEEQEPVWGMIVKVEVTDTRRGQRWHVHLLVDEKVEIFRYTSLYSFLSDWDVLKKQ
jgi:hypothetical protein